MAEFLGADIHQEILAVRIFAIEALNRVLHRGRELAVGAAELLKQHVAEAGIGLVDANGVHKFFDMMIHGRSPGWDRLLTTPVNRPRPPTVPILRALIADLCREYAAHALRVFGGVSVINRY